MPTDATPVFDPATFHSRTMGSAALQVEVLSLFIAEAERLLRQVEAADTIVRGERLRALIALARNVGAARLAQEARLLEAQAAADAPDLHALRTALADTVAYVQRTGV